MEWRIRPMAHRFLVTTLCVCLMALPLGAAYSAPCHQTGAAVKGTGHSDCCKDMHGDCKSHTCCCGEGSGQVSSGCNCGDIARTMSTAAYQASISFYKSLRSALSLDSPDTVFHCPILKIPTTNGREVEEPLDLLYRSCALRF